MKLIPDLREFIELLNSENVRYLVIGGWAYNRYAEPRFTGDIDFFCSDALENQQRLRAALERFGFKEALSAGPVVFTKPIIMLGRPPHRIDLICKIDGIDFDAAWVFREPDTLDGLPVWFISRSDLIRNKQAAGRPKDLADVDSLQRMEKKSD